MESAAGENVGILWVFLRAKHFFNHFVGPLTKKYPSFVRIWSEGESSSPIFPDPTTIYNVIYGGSKSKIIEIFEKRYIWWSLYMLVTPCIPYSPPQGKKIEVLRL